MMMFPGLCRPEARLFPKWAPTWQIVTPNDEVIMKMMVSGRDVQFKGGSELWWKPGTSSHLIFICIQ
jgi:hypothetical protein